MIVGDCAPTLTPQGELLELEEAKPYGLWNGERWSVDHRGRTFHTPYLGIARLELKDTLPTKTYQWHICIIGLDGEPEDIECP